MIAWWRNSVFVKSKINDSDALFSLVTALGFGFRDRRANGCEGKWWLHRSDRVVGASE
jgi:hypothetical protein